MPPRLWLQRKTEQVLDRTKNRMRREQSMKMRKRFPWGASQAALISATSLLSGMAIAQEASKPANDQEAANLDEIVITGTSIKGVTPIGSNLVSVGVDELEKSAAT